MRRLALMACALLVLGGASALAADHGLYVGAGVGQSYQDYDTGTLPGFDFNDQDFAYKVYVGFRPANFFAVEGGYREFGEVKDTSGMVTVKSETTSWDAEGLGILAIGPVDIFGKLGVAQWDTKLRGDFTGSTDDTSAVYGIGVAFRLGSIGIRAEYEYFDTDIPDSLSMLTVGANFTF